MIHRMFSGKYEFKGGINNLGLNCVYEGSVLASDWKRAKATTTRLLLEFSSTEDVMFIFNCEDLIKPQPVVASVENEETEDDSWFSRVLWSMAVLGCFFVFFLFVYSGYTYYRAYLSFRQPIPQCTPVPRRSMVPPDSLPIQNVVPNGVQARRRLPALPITHLNSPSDLARQQIVLPVHCPPTRMSPVSPNRRHENLYAPLPFDDVTRMNLPGYPPSRVGYYNQSKRYMDFIVYSDDETPPDGEHLADWTCPPPRPPVNDSTDTELGIPLYDQRLFHRDSDIISVMSCPY